METRIAHGKLLGLLCLGLTLSASLAVLTGCGGLSSDRQARNAAFQSYDQVVESYNEIVPGMTNAQDLPGLGFNTQAATVGILSPTAIAARFSYGAQQPGAVRDCIQAGAYCTGFVFHPSHRSPDTVAAGFLLFPRASSWSADVTLLVMNGRVVHKVFARTTRPATY